MTVRIHSRRGYRLEGLRAASKGTSPIGCLQGLRVRRTKPKDGLRSVVIGGNMNLRCEARVQMEQPRTDKLRRRSMIVGQERVGTGRATDQRNGLKCNRPRQAPTDATSQVETAIDRERRVRSVSGG